MKIIHLILGIILINAAATLAYAQKSAPALNGAQAPVEISADNTLEWHQKDKQYIANGNVEAKQGDVTIFAEKIIADYRDNNKGNNVEIWQLTAQENVRIKNLNATAIGDQAVYNVENGIATLTGKNLKLTTPDQVISASQRIEYNTIKGIAKAVGNAKIIQGDNTLQADTINANFAKDKSGKQVLKTATAHGSVTIKTPDETLTGDSGIYNAKRNTAEVKGNVKITRGPNILNGARAEVNLTTNISKIFGDPNSGTRVKAVFFPGSSKKIE